MSLRCFSRAFVGAFTDKGWKGFFGLSGSDANDTQVKLLWYYNNAIGRPEKKKIISRKRGITGSRLQVVR